MNIIIRDIEYYLPETIITNDFLVDKFGFEKDFLDNKIGIKERHIAAKNESVSTMAVKAAHKIFDKGSILIDEINAVIVCTQNPDYKLPTTACLIQNELGISKSSMSFDINLGCSGFVYSLTIIASLIQSGIVSKVLLILADEYSKIINYSDKNTASLFGDAAAACIIEKGNNEQGIISYDFGTDGNGACNLIAFNSGAVKQSDKDSYLFMNGREIFKFSITTVPQSIHKTLENAKISIQEIKYFVFHQANKYMLQEIQKKLQIDDKQMIIDMEMVGNTVSATIPIAYKNLIENKKLVEGDLIIFCGFGVGLSWGTILYKV